MLKGRRRSLWHLVAVIWLMALPPAVVAQEELTIAIARVDANQFPRITAVISVLDPSGRPVQGLERSRFAVTEDGETRGLVSVENVVDTQVGIAVAMAIDTSGSMQGTPLQAAKGAAAAFVENLSAVDEAAILAFANTVQTVQSFTSDQQALVSSIEGLQAGGFSPVFEAALQVVQTAAGSELPRRVAVVLTDGRDEGGLSQAGPTDAIELAQAAQVPVYTIALGFQADLEYLTELAEQTGGRAFQAPSPSELEALFLDLSEVLRSQYVLTIDSGVPADGELHELTITVTADGGSAEATSSFTSPRIPPTIAVRGLTGGAVVSRELQVVAAVDAYGSLSQVAFLLDGSELATFHEEPFQVGLDPMELAPGDHELEVIATDQAGTTSQISVGFRVAAIPPVVSLPGLEQGGSLDGPVRLVPEIRSQTPVERVEYRLDDEVLARTTSPPFAFVLDPDEIPSGSHLLTVAAIDREGSRGEIGLRIEVEPGLPYDPLVLAAVLLSAGIVAAALLGVRMRRRALATADVPVDEERVRTRLLFLTQPPEVEALLVFQDQQEEEQVFRLQRHPQTIGWDESCDIRVGSQEGRMAPVHARISYENGAYRIQDLGSASGTKVNGRAVPETVLEDGDTIEIGEIHLRFKHV